MVKIGLEIHGYLNTNEKLFCDCKSEHGLKNSKPNINICPICTSQPGSKPMLPNKSAINKCIEISLILGCKINEKLIWQRKHYSWPDLPKGFQNTISGPYATPNGTNGNFLGIKITECHLEEDPASWNPKTGEIDYNRSGSSLIEIVTDPDFKNSDEVIDWLKQLVTTLSYIKAIDKFAGIKADVNVSIPKGKRVEIKNINSLKNIKTAIDFEIERQKKDLPKIQETRMFNETKGITILMRTKENAQDYRFITEPDLPTINIDKKIINEIKSKLPETPHEKLKKIIKKHKIEKKHAEILTKKLDVVEFFEKIIEKAEPKLAVRWVTEELLRVLNYAKKELEEVHIDPYNFVELLDLIESGALTELKAKDILNEFIPVSFSPKIKLKEHSRISSQKDINDFVKKVLKENPKAVEDYKKGKKESLNFLIGQVMKASNKRADFKTAKELLEKELD
jgi:aspartyl-tRNA(Asn)/glutamyl-tRNA(Gln) amidotransferase subunit B